MIVPWEPSVIVFAVLMIAAVFFWRSGRGLPWWRRGLFWLGMLGFYLTLQTGFDYYAEHEFFMHRIQHMVLHHLAPFCIALAAPGAAMRGGVPARWRNAVERFIAGLRPIAKALNHPAMAVLIFDGLIALWLIPRVHFVAMLDWRLYRLMNWGMAINGLMFWTMALDRNSAWPPGIRIIVLLAIIPAQIIMGALLSFSQTELYPLYTLCGRAFGMSALDDQHLGGFILWVPAAMMSVAGMLIVVGRHLVRPARS